jgi:hypothetical protein
MTITIVASLQAIITDGYHVAVLPCPVHNLRYVTEGTFPAGRRTSYYQSTGCDIRDVLGSDLVLEFFSPESEAQ